MKKIIPILTIILSSLFAVLSSYIFLSLSSVPVDNTNSEIEHNKLMSLETNIVSLAKKASPSVVSIIITKDLWVYKRDPWGFFQYKIWSVQKQVWGWTGFFINSNGVIITNKHVISDTNSQYSVILNDGTEYNAEIIAVKKDNDIAFLRIIAPDKAFIPLEFINKWDISIWQFSLAIWNALAEFKNSVSFWVVSGINREIRDNYINLQWLIQTDTAINPWNSWGPLLNLEWKVMWINTAIINGSQNIWFAIELSQDEVDEYLKQIQ